MFATAGSPPRDEKRSLCALVIGAALLVQTTVARADQIAEATSPAPQLNGPQSSSPGTPVPTPPVSENRSAAPVPQDRTVERSARAAAGKAVQIGVYLNVQQDCSSGTLPAIRLVGPPSNGTVQIKRGKVTATNYKQCLALEVPGFIAFYQSRADFAGADSLTLEIIYPQGRREVQRITVHVGMSGGGQKI